MKKGWKKWKDIEGYEGLYQINRQGIVKSLGRYMSYNRFKQFTVFKKERILKPKTTNTGYLQVSLCKDGKAFSKNVHRLVAIAFIPNPLNLPEINHIKGKGNNYKNLEWVTSQQNKDHAVKNKLNAFGERITNSKLTDKDVIQIKKLKGREKVSILAKTFNISEKHIYKIFRNEIWKHIK